MTALIGDILNWAAAGVLFPIMLAPLAILMGATGRMGAAVLALLAAIAVLAGAAFTTITPVLRATPNQEQAVTFFAMLAILTGVIFSVGGPASVVSRLAPIFDRIVKGVGQTVMWLILAMAFVQFTVVFLRYVFGLNYIFMQESITYMHGAVFLLAAGYALFTNDHVRVDIFYREAPPRRKALVDFVGVYIFLFPIALLLLWTAGPYVANSWAVREGSTETSGIQGVFLLKTLIPMFAVLLILAGFSLAARAGDTLKGRA